MLLSIIICNHNYGHFLDAAIRSALNQSQPDTEVIVVDDGSTDGSRELLSRWNGRVHCIFQENSGQAAAYNRGFEAARGDVLIFLDSDDLLDRDVGEQLVEQFRDSEVVKVHYRLRLVDTDGRALGSIIPRRLAEGDLASALLERGQLYESSPGSGNAYRRSALARLMPLPVVATDRVGADFFTIYGISLLGRVRSLGTGPHASYRVHGGDPQTKLYLGNAGDTEPGRMQERYLALEPWIAARLGSSYKIANASADFSTEKHAFANAVFRSSYVSGLQTGARFLMSNLAPSIAQRRSSWAERLGLMGWAVAVLILPREFGKPLARYVCNPASRG